MTTQIETEVAIQWVVYYEGGYQIRQQFKTALKFARREGGIWRIERHLLFGAPIPIDKVVVAWSKEH